MKTWALLTNLRQEIMLDIGLLFTRWKFQHITCKLKLINVEEYLLGSGVITSHRRAGIRHRTTRAPCLLFPQTRKSIGWYDRLHRWFVSDAWGHLRCQDRGSSQVDASWCPFLRQGGESKSRSDPCLPGSFVVVRWGWEIYHSMFFHPPLRLSHYFTSFTTLPSWLIPPLQVGLHSDCFRYLLVSSWVFLERVSLSCAWGLWWPSRWSSSLIFPRTSSCRGWEESDTYSWAYVGSARTWTPG